MENYEKPWIRCWTVTGEKEHNSSQLNSTLIKINIGYSGQRCGRSKSTSAMTIPIVRFSTFRF